MKKLREDGVSESDLQKQGSSEYQQLSPNSKERYSEAAKTQNNALSQSSGIPKEKMICRLVKNIESSVSI